MKSIYQGRILMFESYGTLTGGEGSPQTLNSEGEIVVQDRFNPNRKVDPCLVRGRNTIRGVRVVT